MKYILAVLTISIISISGIAQRTRCDSGPYKGFLREVPPLNIVELGRTLRVSVVHGTISYSDGSPIEDAAFEIRDGQGKVQSVRSDSKGRFTIASVTPGTYLFKVTKNQFHSVVGTVIVSPKISLKKSIHIELPLGT